MRNSEGAKSAGAQSERAQVTAGEAAKIIGVSRSTVIRLCKEDALDYTWTRGDAATHDRLGRRLRGHRRVYLDSAQEYAKALAEMKAVVERTMAKRREEAGGETAQTREA